MKLGIFENRIKTAPDQRLLQPRFSQALTAQIPSLIEETRGSEEELSHIQITLRIRGAILGASI